MGHAGAEPGNNMAAEGIYSPALTQPHSLLQTCSLKILPVLARQDPQQQRSNPVQGSVPCVKVLVQTVGGEQGLGQALQSWDRQRQWAALLSPSTPVPQTVPAVAHMESAHMRHASIPQTSFPEVIQKTRNPGLVGTQGNGSIMNKSVRAGGSSQGPSTGTGAEVEQGSVRYHQATVSNVNSSSKEAGGHLFWETLTP